MSPLFKKIINGLIFERVSLEKLKPLAINLNFTALMIKKSFSRDPNLLMLSNSNTRSLVGRSLSLKETNLKFLRFLGKFAILAASSSVWTLHRTKRKGRKKRR